MNIKPTPEQVDDWELEAAKYAESQTSEYYEYQQAKNEKFAELAAQWGAAQAQQTTEPELPEAVAYAQYEDHPTEAVGDVVYYHPNNAPKSANPLYTSRQMHDHFQAGVRAGAAGWRTIDSAPKDGRSFDVWVKSTKNPDYGVRMTGVYYVQGVLCGSRFPNSSWGEYASHWMPLPAAPKEQQ